MTSSAENVFSSTNLTLQLLVCKTLVYTKREFQQQLAWLWCLTALTHHSNHKKHIMSSMLKKHTTTRRSFDHSLFFWFINRSFDQINNLNILNMNLNHHWFLQCGELLLIQKCLNVLQISWTSQVQNSKSLIFAN